MVYVKVLTIGRTGNRHKMNLQDRQVWSRLADAVVLLALAHRADASALHFRQLDHTPLQGRMYLFLRILRT